MRTAPIALLAFALACRFPNADQHFGLDADGDGIGLDDDCDDNDATVFPGADELCNGDDDDCNGDIDDDPTDAETFHVDADGDGVGNENGATTTACGAPDGFALATGDCDDDDGSRFPGNAEIADDDIDQDCNGDDTITCFTDADQDGWGIATEKLAPDGSCDTADSESANDDDCADNDDTRFPGANEIVGDSIDQNCDGFDTPPCYHDDDDDTFGDALDPIGTNDCAGSGGVTDATDCDDVRATVHPGATEACDGRPSDCADWTTPTVPGAPPANELDDDNDGFVECTFASGINAGNWGNTETPAVTGGADCNDSYATVNPNPGGEHCDGFPSDCDNWTNFTTPGTRPATEVDDDNDTFVECTFASGITAGNWGNTESPAVTAGGDCNDAVGTGENDGGLTIFPGAPEVCDGRVNACGGALPASEIDNDNDAYVECEFASGVDAGNWANNETPDVAGDEDCDDANVLRSPGADELCDDVDNDCDGVNDDTDPDSVGVLTIDDGSGLENFPLNPANFVSLSFDYEGTAWLCPGEFQISITFDSADATLIGRYGAAVTTLLGLDNGTPDRERLLDTATASVLTDVITVEGLTIEEGLAGTSGNGGGFRIQGTPEVHVIDCVFTNNDAVRGGAIHVNGGELYVSGTTFEGNAATASGSTLVAAGGGGIFIFGGTVDISGDTTFTTNTVSATATGSNGISNATGGAIHLTTGALTISDGLFTGNTSTATGTGGGTPVPRGVGGALHMGAGTLTIDGAAEFSGNVASHAGGAFSMLTGNATVTGAEFDANRAAGLSGYGGGAIAITDGTLALNSTQITNNRACATTTSTCTGGNDGGGLLVSFDDDGGVETPTITMSLTTISGNSATDWGGGIACHGPCNIDVDDTFITNNIAAQGGGILLDDAGASFDCDATQADAGGVTGNEATATSSGSAVSVGDGAQINTGSGTTVMIDSSGCNWGTTTPPQSVDIGFEDGTKNYASNATFTCDFDSCSP